MTTTNNIASRAMLVSLSISQWTARKQDKQATNEVLAEHSAASDAGRFNKQTIDKSALLPIQQVASQARDFFNKHTLPWGYDGINVLSNMNYFKVMDSLKEFNQKFDAEVETFLKDYDVHRERARLRLNSLFKDEDYPQVCDIRHKFNFSFSLMPLPTAGDFRVEMEQDALDEVRAEIETNLNGRVRGMMQALSQDLRGTVSHLRERLAASGPLHESALTNLQDLLDRLPGLNFTNDAALDQIRSELRQITNGLTIKDIKKDDKLRANIADQTAAILAKMQGLV